MKTLKEDFLHYLWSNKKIPFLNLHTENQQSVEILSWGYHNVHSGPDFKECVVKIGDTIWAGQVEMHLKASDWYRHKHQEDHAYNNVVLHVVWKYDCDVKINDAPLPVIALEGKIKGDVLQRYQKLLSSEQALVCHKQLPDYNKFEWKMWLQRLAAERVYYKVNELQKLFRVTNHNLERTIYIAFFKCFGMKLNHDPMMRLALRFPFALLHKYKNEPDKIRALFWGMSGWFHVKDESSQWIKWKEEYQYLRKLHQINFELQPREWLMGRLRPLNFPSVRLAQSIEFFIALSNAITQIKNYSVEDWWQFMECLELPEYWEYHYLPGDKSRAQKKTVGRAFVNHFLINAVVPVLFLLSEVEKNDTHKSKAMEILKFLPPEKNNITKPFERVNKKPENALESQAQIHLFKYYCRAKKCLNCTVGNSILNQ